jgi:DNA-binding transcriptional MerR regulator
MAFDIVMQNKDHEPLLAAGTAACMAQVDIEFLISCEHYGMIRPKVFAGSIRRYSLSDVRRVEMIYRMHKDLSLDLDAVSVVMHLREQVIELQRQLDEKEQEWRKKEQSMRTEIHRLRQGLAKTIKEYVY